MKNSCFFFTLVSVGVICSLQVDLYCNSLYQRLLQHHKFLQEQNLKLSQIMNVLNFQEEHEIKEAQPLLGEQRFQPRSSQMPVTVVCGYNTFTYDVSSSFQGTTIKLNYETFMEPGGAGNVLDGTRIASIKETTLCGQCYLQASVYDVDYTGSIDRTKLRGSVLLRIENDGSLVPVIFPGGTGDVIDGAGLIAIPTTICGRCYITAFIVDLSYSGSLNLTGTALWRVEHNGSLTPLILPGGYGDIFDGTGLAFSIEITICGQCYLQVISLAVGGGNLSFGRGSALFRIEDDGSLTPIIFPGGTGDIIDGTGFAFSSELMICGKCYFQSFVVDFDSSGNIDPTKITGSALVRVEPDGSFIPVMLPGGYGDVVDGKGIFLAGEIMLCGKCYLQGVYFDGEKFAGYALWSVGDDGSLIPELLPNGQQAPSAELLDQLLCQASYGFPILFSGPFPLNLLILTLQSNKVSEDYLCRLVRAVGEDPLSFYLSCSSCASQNCCLVDLLQRACAQGPRCFAALVMLLKNDQFVDLICGNMCKKN